MTLTVLSVVGTRPNFMIAEGADPGSIHDVGNTMIDTLVAMRHKIEALGAPAAHGLELGSYLLVTLHRPALVDGPLLAEAIRQLEAVARELTVVFPVHPRTRRAMEALEVRAGEVLAAEVWCDEWKPGGLALHS